MLPQYIDDFGAPLRCPVCRVQTSQMALPCKLLHHTGAPTLERTCLWAARCRIRVDVPADSAAACQQCRGRLQLQLLITGSSHIVTNYPSSSDPLCSPQIGEEMPRPRLRPWSNPSLPQAGSSPLLLLHPPMLSTPMAWKDAEAIADQPEVANHGGRECVQVQAGVWGTGCSRNSSTNWAPAASIRVPSIVAQCKNQAPMLWIGWRPQHLLHLCTVNGISTVDNDSCVLVVVHRDWRERREFDHFCIRQASVISAATRPFLEECALLCQFPGEIPCIVPRHLLSLLDVGLCKQARLGIVPSAQLHDTSVASTTIMSSEPR
mmetsp:Transcript_58967/g.120741  ORF Transcript_58967/g.120741 Transcript_58967/m.120741 type:complete len:320 (-) Transcript_58967:536-1495(-)